MPSDKAQYIHRLGRTARATGRQRFQYKVARLQGRHTRRRMVQTRAAAARAATAAARARLPRAEADVAKVPRRPLGEDEDDNKCCICMDVMEEGDPDAPLTWCRRGCWCSFPPT